VARFANEISSLENTSPSNRRRCGTGNNQSGRAQWNYFSIGRGYSRATDETSQRRPETSIIASESSLPLPEDSIAVGSLQFIAQIKEAVEWRRRRFEIKEVFSVGWALKEEGMTESLEAKYGVKNYL
jgi:hypothetical protein